MYGQIMAIKETPKSSRWRANPALAPVPMLGAGFTLNAEHLLIELRQESREAAERIRAAKTPPLPKLNRMILEELLASHSQRNT